MNVEENQANIDSELFVKKANNSGSKAEVSPFISKITEQIGKGDDAKHSIIWLTIKFSFITAGIFTIISFVFLTIAYFNNEGSQIESMQRFIMSIWSIFSPLITLSLGYAFGKDKN
ncbi:hypothetical protein ACG9Y7_04070 [Acinetobacter gerneri]|uniref:hypothetical protein n=1 Tax=Acinetobacter gerneri TaxID=202952 RepID=UPI003AF97766